MPGKAPTAAPRQSEDRSLFLLGSDGIPRPLSSLQKLDTAYRYWTYVVANRLRIDEVSRAQLQARAQAEFVQLGITLADLNALAGSNVIEVSIPYTEEPQLWAARICPWESLLSLATKPLRKPDQHPTIVRHLRRLGHQPAPAGKAPESLLVVVSAPGRLKSFFNFDSERHLICDAFSPQFSDDAIHYAEDPTVDELRALIERTRADVIHFAGIDSHQGAALLRTADNPLDGFYLRSSSNEAVAVGAEELADTVTLSGEHQPRLVSFNCYNSGARLAAMTVARGAGAALAFQDTIDDAIAEQFFTYVYSVWRELRFGNLLDAFILARQQLTSGSPGRSCGDVVLWTDTSYLAKTDHALEQFKQIAGRAHRNAEPWLNAISVEFKRLSATETAAEVPPSEPDVIVKPGAAGTQAAKPDLPPAPAIARPGLAQALAFEVKPLEQLNYSLMHNHRAIFKRFRIVARDTSVLPVNLEIKVHLFAGEGSFCIRACHTINTPLTDLHEGIHLPLISPMLRGRREGISSALTSEICCDGQLLHCETSPLRLLPADEWTDTDEDRRWLPSFILPRDPAVQRIFESAQRYLRALADDSTASFDGYQRVVDTSDDSLQVVDLQVRALWCALLYDHPVAYINPPPTYTQNAQRIRSPSQMMDEGRGTCIDLALLFAASLEYLGIMPVMFLIHGHAFPGYWRSPTAQTTFWEFGNVNPDAISSKSSYGEKIREGWMVQGDGGLAEITRAIQTGGLVPLETTALPNRGAFQAAQELGVRSLMTPWGFDAMIEIQRARERGVTPLPLLHLDL